MENYTSEIISRAQSLIKKGWCQGSAACDQYGNDVDHDSPEAVAWCISGALVLGVERLLSQHPGKTGIWDDFNRVLSLIEERTGKYHYTWNDEPGRTKEEVLHLLEDVKAAISQE